MIKEEFEYPIKKIICEEINQADIKLNEKLESLDHFLKEIEELKSELNSIKMDIEKLKCKEKRKNLIIYGLGRWESISKTEDILIDLIKNIMKVRIDKSNIEFLRNLQKKNLPDRNDGVVLLGLTTFRKKEEILASRSKLETTNVFIHEDFEKHNRDKRKKTIPVMQLAICNKSMTLESKIDYNLRVI